MNDVPQSSEDPIVAPGRVLKCAEPEERSTALEAAVAAVRRGACVVLPTDTVYGIGADAFSSAAVRGLLAAKGRGRDKPPPVLIGDPGVLMALGREIPEAAKKLAERFWPGALTLILHAQSSLQMDLGDTEGTIAVRVPDHELARELLRATGPLAVSSANKTGAAAATSATEAQEQLGDRVEVYLDAGTAASEVPSTIVDFTTSDYGVVVRAGQLSVAELREVVPYLEEAPAEASPLEEPPVAETSPQEEVPADEASPPVEVPAAEASTPEEGTDSSDSSPPDRRGEPEA